MGEDFKHNALHQRDHSDVTFVVEGERVHCHKVIVCTLKLLYCMLSDFSLLLCPGNYLLAMLSIPLDVLLGHEREHDGGDRGARPAAPHLQPAPRVPLHGHGRPVLDLAQRRRGAPRRGESLHARSPEAPVRGRAPQIRRRRKRGCSFPG